MKCETCQNSFEPKTKYHLRCETCWNKLLVDEDQAREQNARRFLSWINSIPTPERCPDCGDRYHQQCVGTLYGETPYRGPFK